jgi:hypothetical protein
MADMKGYTRRRSFPIIVGLLGLPLFASPRAYSDSAGTEQEGAAGPDLVVVGGWIVDRRDLPLGPGPE